MIRRANICIAIFIIIALLLICSSIVYYQVKYRYLRKSSNIKEQVLLIKKGDSLSGIGDKLYSDKIDNLVFKIMSRITEKDKELKTGEFLLESNSSMKDVLDLLSSNNTISYKLTIVEGAQKYQVKESLESAEKLSGEIPEITEGMFLPNTYFYKLGDSKEEVLNRAKLAMDEYLEKAWQNRDKTIPLKTKEEALVLASIVEEETGVQSEYPLVASVFINRLNRGMKLQADSTSVYGITNGEQKFGRKLYKGDLNKKNGYNTYYIKRLPVAPISNPSRLAIDAVMNPAQTKYLYFVADGSGGHVFSKSAREHQNNVNKWRKIKNKMNK